MTADGTYRSARAGETITATVSSFYGDLPNPDDAEVAFVVPRDIARRFTLGSTITVTLDPSPDAPQPATTDDAVERAARRVDNTKALLVEQAVESVIARGGITPDKVQEIRVAIGEVLG